MQFVWCLCVLYGLCVCVCYVRLLSYVTRPCSMLDKMSSFPGGTTVCYWPSVSKPLSYVTDRQTPPYSLVCRLGWMPHEPEVISVIPGVGITYIPRAEFSMLSRPQVCVRLAWLALSPANTEPPLYQECLITGCSYQSHGRFISHHLPPPAFSFSLILSFLPSLCLSHTLSFLPSEKLREI